MSACISREGEFSDHVDDDEYVCRRCGVLDEEALLGELRRLRAAAAGETYPLTPVTGAEAWNFGQPSVAQWARREALHEAREWCFGIGNSPRAVHSPGQSVIRGYDVEVLALRWARLIETGEVDE